MTPQKQTDGLQARPEFVRIPRSGEIEFFSGMRRSAIRKLITAGKIRTVLLLEPGRTKGVRLIHLQSLIDYINSNNAE